MRARVLPLPSWLSDGDPASSASPSGAALSVVRFRANAGREGEVELYGEIIMTVQTKDAVG